MLSPTLRLKLDIQVDRQCTGDGSGDYSLTRFHSRGRSCVTWVELGRIKATFTRHLPHKRSTFDILPEFKEEIRLLMRLLFHANITKFEYESDDGEWIHVNGKSTGGTLEEFCETFFAKLDVTKNKEAELFPDMIRRIAYFLEYLKRRTDDLRTKQGWTCLEPLCTHPDIEHARNFCEGSDCPSWNILHTCIKDDTLYALPERRKTA